MMSRYLKTFCVFVLYYCGQIHYISKFRLSLDGQHSSFPSLRGFVPVPLCFSDSLDLPHYILVARRGSVKLLLSCSALHGGTALCVLPPPQLSSCLLSLLHGNRSLLRSAGAISKVAGGQNRQALGGGEAACLSQHGCSAERLKLVASHFGSTVLRLLRCE